MGRGCTMDEWVHFEKLPEHGRVPNSSYWYVHCRHCAAGFAQKQLVNPPAKLTGRRTSMRAHLKVCPVYAARYKAELAAAAAIKAQLQQEHQEQEGALPIVSAAADAAITGNVPPSVDGAAVVAAGAQAEGAPGVAIAVAGDQVKVAIANAAQAAAAGVTVEEPGAKRKRKIDSGEVIGPRGGRGKHCMMEEWDHFTRLQDEGYIGKTNFFHAICKHCQRAYDEAPAEKKSALAPERMVGRREKMRKHLSLCPHFRGELPPVERRVVMRGVTPFPPVNMSLELSDGAKSATSGSILQPSPPAAAAMALAASVAAKQAAATASGGNSRLAMDEWQYFTRLERKKDSAYYYARCNFCESAFENAAEPLKSSMEPVIVVGRKANMQTHLSKCPHVPKDMVTFTFKALPLASDSSSSAAGSVTTGGSDALGIGRENHPHAAKRARTDTRDDSAPVVDLTALYSSLLEFTIQHRLPFEWTASESTKKLFRSLAVPEMDAQLPTAEELRTQVLNETYGDLVSSELLQMKEPLPSPFGASTVIAGDAAAVEDSPNQSIWPLMVHCTATLSTLDGADSIPVLQFNLTNGKIHVPVQQIVKKRVIKSSSESPEEAVAAASAVQGEITAVTHYHGLEVARWMDTQMRQCELLQHIVPAVVVLPYSSVFDRAVKILRARWPRVVFVYDFQGLLQFCLQKVFASEEVQSLVAALADLWTSEAIVRLASHISRPFTDWQECSLFVQSLLDESTLFSTNAELKSKVDEKVSRGLLERVSLLLRAFSVAYESASEKQLSFAETVRQIGALYHASEGFASIQRALEVIWSEMEQPLFILAHVMHPHLRLGDMASSDLTKLSKLSDLGVTYFADLFRKKATSLRGEMTAYLHTSQPVFSQDFVSEFPVLDDYFRYLSDDYTSLSMLMRLLLSFSSVCSNKEKQCEPKSSSSAAKQMYTAEERKKIAYLIERWNIKQISNYGEEEQQDEPALAATVAVPDDDIPTQTGEYILLMWNRALVAASSEQGVDFALLEKKHAAVETLADSVEAVGDNNNTGAAAASGNDQVLASHAPEDDEAAYPSTFLRGDRAKKISLKELFKPVEATI